MTENEVVELMLSSKTELEWDDNCDKVKAAHGGFYPAYWFNAILVSGLFNVVSAFWVGRETG